MAIPPIPSIETNFTPFPNSLTTALLESGLSRQGLLAVLYTVYTTYGWVPRGATVSPSEFASVCGLEKDEARQGLEEATAAGFLIRMETDDGTASFLVGTADNRRMVSTYDTEPDEGSIVPSTVNEPMTTHRMVEEAPPTSTESTMTSSNDVELPYHPRTIEMLIKLVGRALTKDERVRLADAGATDPQLIEAMSSLLSKTNQVYSTDLVIYEHERLVTRARQAERYEHAKLERERTLERQRSCHRCDGLGYVFAGVNNIHECECRKK